MSKKLFLSKKFYILFILFFTFIFCLTGFSFSRAKADESESAFSKQIFLPCDKAEVFGFNGSTPKDALYLGNDKYAVVNTDKTLWVYQDGEYLQGTKDDHGNLKYLSQDKFVVLSKNVLYTFDVSTKEYKAIYSGDDVVTASFFDLVGNNLVTKTNSGEIYRFSIDLDGNITSDETRLSKITATDDSYICTDAQSNVYYINGSGENSGLLFMYDGENSKKICDVEGISTMVSHDEYIYFIANKNVYRLNTADWNLSTLSSQTDSSFDLGYLRSPSNLSFKGENLLISDPETGAVQEFRVDNNKLVWTGFAIAKNKTAFNRITDKAFDIERYGDLLAVLSEQKITVISQEESFDTYSEEFFINLFPQDLPAELAVNGSLKNISFALGNGSLILANNLSGSVALSIYNVNAREEQSQFTNLTLPLPAVHAHDVCYQSGFYYVLSDTNDNKLILHKIDQKDGAIVDTRTFNSMTNPVFTVNVYGFPFVFDESEQIIKLSSDLKGNVFALKTDGKLYRYSFDDQTKEITQDQTALPTPDCHIESFAMSFDKTDVYFICDDQEFIYISDCFGNVAIDGVDVTDEYLLSATSAKPDQLFFFDCGENAFTSSNGNSVNLYAVSDADGKFTFDQIVFPKNVEQSWENRNYVVVCYLQSPGIYVLAGQDGVILADLTQDDLTVPTFTQQDKTVFVTTDVHSYYLPIITRENTFVLKDATRLPRSAEVSVVSSFTFLQRSYYVASFEVDGTTTYGYIPMEFTTEVLAKDRVFTPFTIKNSQGATVFSEQSLENAIGALSEGDVIKLYSTTNGVSKIRFLKDGVWIEGFINHDDIVEKQNNTIRNVLILLAVTACVCGSITFFILRKKEV